MSKVVKKRSDTISLMGDFKYFVQIEKAYEESGDWFVQGIASGTSEDLDDCRFSRSALQKFVDGLPLPLTDNHEKGEVLANLGEVVEARLLEDDSLFIKARLDKEHPAVPYLVKKVGQGKKYAFSVEGLLKKAKTVYSEMLQKFITEYIDIQPEAISITTRPAYQPSFLEVVSKSYKKTQEDNIKKEQEMTEIIKEEQVEPVVEETKSIEPEKSEEVDEVVEVSEATEAKEEEKSEEVAEEKNDAQEEAQEAVQEEESKQEEEVETTDSAEEDKSESQEDKIEQLNQKVENLTDLVSKLVVNKTDKVDEPVSQPKPLTPIEEALEMIQKNNVIIKSLQDKVENLERLPLQKKTRASLPVIEKSTDNEDKPKTITDVAEQLA